MFFPDRLLGRCAKNFFFVENNIFRYFYLHSHDKWAFRAYRVSGKKTDHKSEMFHDTTTNTLLFLPMQTNLYHKGRIGVHQRSMGSTMMNLSS